MSFKTKLRSFLPNWLVNTFWHLPKAILANLLYGFPSRNLTIIGITGTSGKTSVCHLLHHILQASGLKAVLISTISAPGLHVTNPEPFVLQKLIKNAVKRGNQYLILEVTSHGLDQHRTWGIVFTYGVITNIRHEHLDYHKTLANYQKAKLKLIKACQIAVLNQDDPSSNAARKIASGKILTFSDHSDFQQANLNAALVVARDLGISQTKLDATMRSFPGIPGRMEIIETKPFTIVIDFAHKPDALEKALQSLNRLKSDQGRIIAVFGCAGLRDVLKRPIMGGISARLADITILTAEDPRTEDLSKIIAAIAVGWREERKANHHRLLIEPDRQKAINLAIKLAKAGDIVGLFGKAHEKSMCFGTIEYPWSEYQAVKKALKLCKH